MGLDQIRRLKIEAGVPRKKKTYVIPAKSEKRLKREREAVVNDENLDGWFEARRKDLVGGCKHCGGKSCKEDDKYYRFSICHILPKAYFPSVATHEDNFIELCFWDKNCHGNMDNKTLDLIDMNCFDEIIEKFQRMYPYVAKEERRRIPQTLMGYVEVDI
jgi:hypothetical protein